MLYTMVFLALLAVALLLAGYRISRLVLHPPRRPLTQNPDEYGLGYEDVAFKSKDGLSLRGWWVPAAAGRTCGHSGAVPVVILLHPMFGNRQGSFTGPAARPDNLQSDLDLLQFSRSFHAAGFAVLLFDFRNHGESQSGVSTGGYTEDQDVVGAVDYVFQRMAAEASGDAPRVGLVGFGLGASAAIAAIGREPGDGSTIRVFSADVEGSAGLVEFQPANVKRLRFLVAVDPAGLRASVNDRLRRISPLLAWLLTPIVAWFCQSRSGYPLDQSLLVDCASQIYAPVLYVHACAEPRNSGDEVQGLAVQTTGFASQGIYEAIPGPKQMRWEHRAGRDPSGKDSLCKLSGDLIEQMVAFAEEYAGLQQPRPELMHSKLQQDEKAR